MNLKKRPPPSPCLMLLASEQAVSAFRVIRLQGLGARDISVAATGEKERSPCAPPLMLVAPEQGPSALWVIRLQGLGTRDISKATAGGNIPYVPLSYAPRS